MIKNSLIIVFLFWFANIFSQVKNDTIDHKYLEDQIFISGSYNILNNKLNKSTNTLFSGGFSLGFIRDIPFNKKRNLGVGIGVGYAFNSYNKEFSFFIDDPNNPEQFNSTKFRTNLVEIPFELRWRTSTATKYNFWRVYPGFKVAYVFASVTKVKIEGEQVKFKNISAFNKMQYGLTLSAGYSMWNIFAYYGLSSIFKDVYVEEKKYNLSDFNIGIKFYIL
jgi:hypothetical protein